MSEVISTETIDLSIPYIPSRFTGTVSGNDINIEKYGTTVSSSRLVVDVMIPVALSDIIYENISVVSGDFHDVSVTTWNIGLEPSGKYRINISIHWTPEQLAGVISFIMLIRGIAYNVVIDYIGPE